MRLFTKKEDQYLRDHYLTVPAKRMAKNLGRSEGTARQRMKILGITVPAEVVMKFRRESQFKKGSISHNKGKKMPAHVYKKAKATMFPKGHLPHNTKMDGAITIRYFEMNSGEMRPYKLIRISVGNWKMLHVFKWEKKYGPVPKGFIIVFKDKDTMNIKLSNLECITKGENMRRNTIHNLPPDIKKSIVVIRTLNRKINKYEKQAV